MKTLKIYIPLILIIFSVTAAAQNSVLLLSEGDKQPKTTKINSDREEVQLFSKILDEKRVITVDLPATYAKDGNRYPVLYLLDGRTHLQHATAAVDFLTNYQFIPEMIVVSIHNIDRSRDFSPVHIERIPTSGGAGKFIEFLSEELLPYVNSTYKTSGYDVILGHSFGGTFVTYSLLTKPDLFDGIIAVSPALQYADNYLVKQANEHLTPLKKSEVYFYMTVGDEPGYFEVLSEFSTAMREKTGGTVHFEYEKFMAENHSTNPYPSTFEGLRFIFSDWQLPQDKISEGLGAIDAHFASVSSKYGLEVVTPELVINALGYRHLQNGETEQAIAIFKENVLRYPGSANTYDSLGEAYEGNSQLDMAAKNYKQACNLGKKSKDPNLDVYMNNLKRVEK